MILDGHIHRMKESTDRGDFAKKLAAAEIAGGLIISLPPACFGDIADTPPPQKRLEDILCWCEPSENLYPFYWIDPLEEDAEDQIAMAVGERVAGFKIICDRYMPGDEKPMQVLRAIARADKPVLFHSGILWDGKPSSAYNRPGGFEPLLEIPGLRFALAHISWPWCDELIAVYGKFLNATVHADRGVEMFVDLTPGTPPIYRREALTKLFTVGYDVENNVIFGSDSLAPDYNGAWVREWIDRDNEIYRELQFGRETLDRIYAGNLLRFLDREESAVSKKIPVPGE